MNSLILASQSPARKALLKRLGIPFEVVPPHLDESPLPLEKAETLVKRLAKAKAEKIQEDYPEHYIIGCDQVGLIHNEFLTKPLTHENAQQQLQKMSNQTIEFYTGVCLLQANRFLVSVETYRVTFRKLTEEMIAHYLAKEKPYHCAGSFQIEGLGISLVEALSGKDYTALIGLPLITLTTMLESFNVGPLS